MKTLLKIAWRNIWRNTTRSLVVVISLAIGIWATVIILAVSDSLHMEALKDGIEYKYGHIQIQNPDFIKNEKLTITIPNGERILKEIRTDDEVKAATARTEVSGIIASAGNSSNVILIGILPGAEEKTTMLKSRLATGEYLSQKVRNPIILGERLAKKLNVKPGNKVVLGFEGKSGELISSTFRITGLYNATQTRDEEMLVYADLYDVTKLAGIEGQYNKIVIKLKEPEQLATYLAFLQSKFSQPDVLVQDWRQANPELELISDMIPNGYYNDYNCAYCTCLWDSKYHVDVHIGTLQGIGDINGHWNEQAACIYHDCCGNHLPFYFGRCRGDAYWICYRFNP